MALSFIGKPISLISHSDVRYRGILAGIDPAASTIQLSNVFSMGTESRRPPNEYIPPVQEPYQYIIFRASEVKDLAVDEPMQQRRNVHDDPAVLGASAGPPGPPPAIQPGYPPVPAVAPQYATIAGGVPPHPQVQQVAPKPPPQQAPVPQPAPAQQQQQQQQQQRGGGSAQTALDSVERAIGDLRGGRRGGGAGRGGGRDIKAGDLRVPTTDFDFESSNKRFDKKAATPKSPAIESGPATPNGNGESDEAGKEVAEAKEDDSAYNPTKSFFDSLSSSASERARGGGGRGNGRRGGGGIGRSRREEERERNVATFGEPGGVGLMGPGAYVGGWGGYGRRGTGRGRRGAPMVGGGRQ
ncbi:hypothetical protein JAAARDRAFT_205014 [Jaapia argillacea MUCL 33604]|uniref:DFDF domain-containing protein n=1 Tax=Jaapia argillacea MUCL 33604 TaxID=933084 RepID=A0A067Q2J5_9AGAM|nr:hypothetical protein JAAARDRAFT_205014 [Jaapia argillacea MUCL 33604]